MSKKKNMLLTTAELAERLGMHEKSLIRWRSEKKGPAFMRSGEGEKGRVFYKLEDVRKWEVQFEYVRRIR